MKHKRKRDEVSSARQRVLTWSHASFSVPKFSDIRNMTVSIAGILASLRRGSMGSSHGHEPKERLFGRQVSLATEK